MTPSKEQDEIVCTECGHRTPRSRDPKFCPSCGAVVQPLMPQPAEGDVKSADEVLASVDAFLQGHEDDDSPDLFPPPVEPAIEGSPTDGPQLSLPTRGSLARGRRSNTERIKSMMDKAQEEEAEYKIKRITVVERKTRRPEREKQSHEKLVCENCRQVYRGASSHIRKCLTCGSSKLHRSTEETTEIKPEEQEEFFEDAPQPMEALEPTEETSEETEKPRRTQIQYYTAGQAEPRPTETTEKNPSSEEVEDLPALDLSPLPLEMDEAPPPSEDIRPASAGGWEAALKGSDPIHRRAKEMSTFSHEYFLNKQVGDYMIKDVLGRGGMGTVFSAVRLKDEVIVALKILPPIFSTDKGKVDRFTKEARSAMKLNHENIVQCYDVGVDGDIHYIAMEYVEGSSVGDLIKAKRALKIEESLRIIKEAAIGLGAAHEKSIIHRDIKPDNIMITHDRRIMIADFGLARDAEASSSLSNTGEIVGTPYYISPEQIDCLEVDPRADIYSLGATIYHLITGKHPFQGATPMEVLLKHMNEKLIPPVDRNPLIPNSVSRLIEKMMEKNRDYRYGSVKGLLNDIAIIERGGVPQISLEKELAQDRMKKKRRRPVVTKPRSQFFVGTIWVILILLVAVIIRFLLLPGIDTSTVLPLTHAFLPEDADWEKVSSFAEAHPGAHQEIIDQCSTFLSNYPQSPSAKEAALLQKRAENALGKRSAAWTADLLSRAKKFADTGLWSRAVTLLADRPDGFSLTAKETQSLAAERRGIVALLSSREKMRFVPAGRTLLRTLSGKTLVKEVPAFYIEAVEVTNADYRRFVEATKRAGPWKDGFPEEQATHPVTQISFEDAKAYAAWAGRRLPREEEWRRAASGDKNLPFPWGSTFLSKKCNYRGAGIGESVEVFSYEDSRSPWGCYNMAGNVFEWTQSGFAPRSKKKAVLGGSYLSPAAAVRTDTRLGALPGYRHPSLGFRCVKDYKDDGS